jgi:hypothetical protein
MRFLFQSLLLATTAFLGSMPVAAAGGANNDSVINDSCPMGRSMLYSREPGAFGFGNVAHDHDHEEDVHLLDKRDLGVCLPST